MYNIANVLAKPITFSLVNGATAKCANANEHPYSHIKYIDELNLEYK